MGMLVSIYVYAMMAGLRSSYCRRGRYSENGRERKREEKSDNEEQRSISHLALPDGIWTVSGSDVAG